MKTTVIHHSADFDGIFCREIARKFLPDAEFIGWDFGDKPLAIPDGQIYILDLPVDRVFGLKFGEEPGDGMYEFIQRTIWIDHHKTSIESHPVELPGYRIDGVAACRLVWQWFTQEGWHPHRNVPLPDKSQFVDHEVNEPLAVRLAGEYDIWDKRDPRAEVFQFGLRSQELSADDWGALLTISYLTGFVDDLLLAGRLLQHYQQQNDAGVVNHRSFIVNFDGLKFLALNTARCNSLTFAAKDVPETGHDALLGFYWTGTSWKVSLYHAKHRTDIDLSQIAVMRGGGGHRGACGFEARALPFLPTPESSKVNN